jgi:hypothetical protein
VLMEKSRTISIFSKITDSFTLLVTTLFSTTLKTSLSTSSQVSATFEFRSNFALFAFQYINNPFDVV